MKEVALLADGSVRISAYSKDLCTVRDSREVDISDADSGKGDVDGTPRRGCHRTVGLG
jgi:hypothetical protein